MCVQTLKGNFEAQSKEKTHQTPPPPEVYQIAFPHGVNVRRVPRALLPDQLSHCLTTRISIIAFIDSNASDGIIVLKHLWLLSRFAVTRSSICDSRRHECRLETHISMIFELQNKEQRY